MEQQRALTVAQRVETKKVITLQHSTATRQKLPLSHPTTEASPTWEAILLDH